MGESQTITEEGEQIFFISLLKNRKHWGIMGTLAEFDSGLLQVGTNPPPLKVFKFG